MANEQAPSKEKVALEYFSAYFEQNYYGTVVFSDPRWHAPKVFRAAMWALQQADKDAGDPIVEAIHKARENKEIARLQREVDYCVINHDEQLKKYHTALEEICTRRRCPTAERALGLSDSPCGCPRDSLGHVKCEERSGPEHTYCVAERNAEDSHEG